MPGAGTTHALSGDVSHRNVELLIGRLATDAALRRRFQEERMQLLQALIAQGFEFSTIEITALAAVDLDALRLFALTLDPRLRKAGRENPITLSEPRKP